MPESSIQPDANHQQNTQNHHTVDAEQTEKQDTSDDEQNEFEQGELEEATIEMESEEKIIWTPTFISTFALVLVLGLSLESLLAVSWSSHLLFVNAWAILAHVGTIALGWVIMGMVSRSHWIRIACIFGGIWSAFMMFNIFIDAQGLDPTSSVLSPINVAICMALLGTYIGLAIQDTLLTKWDSWVLLLLPILGISGVALTYLLTPQASILNVENTSAIAALIACSLIWWLRPSCWKTQPGPTFLFGVAPAILLAIAALHNSMHDLFLLQITYNQAFSSVNNVNNFFFAQVVLLCLLLGCLRITKSELNK